MVTYDSGKDIQKIGKTSFYGILDTMIICDDFALIICLPKFEFVFIVSSQVFKGGLFKVATESKEQFRYFSNQVYMQLYVQLVDFFLIKLYNI